MLRKFLARVRERFRPKALFLLDFLEQAARENAELREMCDASVAKIKALEGDNEELFELLAELEAESKELREDLRATRYARLEELAQGPPPIPELLGIIVRIREREEREEREEILRDFPLVSAFEDGAFIIYEPAFREAFDALENGEKRQVAKALGLLSEHGAGYPSLRTLKNEKETAGAPAGSFISRASRELRFFWKRAEETIVVFGLLRRSDTRFPYREV